ncbi:MAG: hypothetical protein GQ582_06735 [Methyloprofundus sp.]|nr:hypothetical protein [Methyloprofundus sp.]
MNLSTKVATLLIVIGGGVFSPFIVAQPSNLAPDTFEFKVMLNNLLFTSDARDAGIDGFIKIIKEQPGIVVDEDKKEKSRIVSYFDTKKCDLLKNNYILRKRFTLKNDVPDRLKITLKYRGAEPDEVGEKSFQAKPSSKLTKSKYEADIVRKSPFKTQKKFSYSGSIELGKMKKISDLLSLYPVLNELGIDDNKKLKTVNNFAAFETVVEIGVIKMGSQECEASFSFWYKNREKKHPIASEFSYVCNKLTDEGGELYQSILRQQNWVNANSSTKTAIAYGDYCNR